jgi:phosphoglycerate dehydrogenase-like enzyme
MTDFARSPTLTIGFAHKAYQLRDEFLARGQPLQSFEVRTLDDLEQRIADAEVLVVSGLWHNELLKHAPKLRLIQSISAGTTNSRGRYCASAASGSPAPKAQTRLQSPNTRSR